MTTYELARRSVASLTDEGHRLPVIAQNLIEFWVVATRPALNNGLALSISDTVAHINRFRETLRLLPDSPAIFPEWQRLAEAHSVSGRQAHDARLVAAMLVQGVTHLLTFNDADFKRYAEITVVNPQDIS
jgi:predicted nucleic acid-binding protein